MWFKYLYLVTIFFPQEHPKFFLLLKQSDSTPAATLKREETSLLGGVELRSYISNMDGLKHILQGDNTYGNVSRISSCELSEPAHAEEKILEAVTGMLFGECPLSNTLFITYGWQGI